MGSEREPRHDSQPIAVIGMGCRLPGDVDSPAALWRLLVDARDTVGDLPADRAQLPQGQSSTPDPLPRWGGYLRDVSGFDADFFGVSGKEADVLDPQHRLLLEVAWEALENAGLAPERLAGTATGLFAGLSYTDYMEFLAGQPRELEGSILTNGHCVAAGRISYLLGLHGPSIALDTACSSSLVAIHLACQALRGDECDLVLAGGVTLILGSRTTRSFVRMGMISPTGRCRTFDASADGFVRGEGCGIVVLKRLADALRDGDRIQAVVRGSAVNQDGRSDGLAAPSLHAQKALFRQALARAGTDPREVGLIETHGTGTPVGDPIEFASLAAVYGVGQGRCALGSIKTNLGHLEPAAGVVGLIKAVLCLQHGLIPPNLHFTRWSPAIHPEGTRLFVPTELTGWPTQTASRLAAVSSFGFSGTNAHLILEQTPTATAQRRPGPDTHPVPARSRLTDPQPTPAQSDAPPEVFLLQAGSKEALPAAARRLAHWIEDDAAATALRDIAHTLALRRATGRGRLAVVALSRHDLVRALRAVESARAHPGVIRGEVGAGISRRPVWVFSGQGSQWPGMGRALLHHEPAFAQALTETDELIAAEAGFHVLDILRAGDRVTGPTQVQPALFALQTALAASWRAHGVEPAAVLGHSMGEVAAAVVAGALTPADGVRVICRRSALMTRIAGAGAMATVGLAPQAVEADLAAAGVTGSVCVAVLAAPDSTVVSGTPLHVRRLVTAWQARGVAAHLIAVDIASHCPQVDPLLADLTTALADLAPRQAAIPFYSTVLDDPRQTPLFNAAYWCANLRRPVRFAAAVAAAAADRHQVYLEISPQPVVTHAITRNLAGLLHDPVVLPTLRRDQDEPTTFRTQLAALHCAGVAVDWTSLYADANLTDVPPLTFDRRRHWVNATASPNPPGTATTNTTLPGTHTLVPGTQMRHCWHGNYGTGALPWLADHRVQDRPVLPGAAYCALALSAACEVFQTEPHQVELLDIHFRELMHLSDHTQASMTATSLAPDRAHCDIFGQGEDGTWVRQASAVLHRPTTPTPDTTVPVAELAARHPVSLDPAALYASLRARGLEHGPAFTGITTLHTTHQGDSFWARVTLPTPARTAQHSLPIHPVLLDLCAQLVVAGLIREQAHGLVLPVHVGRMRILGDPHSVLYCHARVTQDDTGITGHVRLLDAAGAPVVDIDALRFVRHDRSSNTSVDRWFLETGWHPLPRREATAPTTTGNWLVIGEADGSAQTLADALRAAGATTDILESAVGPTPLTPLRSSLTRRWAAPAALPRAVVLLCAPPTPGTDPDTTALRRTRRLLAVAQAAAAHAEPPRLYAVTRTAQSLEPDQPPDLGQSALRGLVRVLTHEHHDLRTTLVDAGPADTDLREVAHELLAWASEDEVVLRGATRHITRLAYTPLTEHERTTATTRTVRYGTDRFQLRAGRLGDLDDLELAATTRRDPGPGEVELRIQAAGLNFRDILTTMGLLSTDDQARYRIGFECSGVIAAIGPDVDHLRVGDTVLAVDLRGGAFASFATVPAAHVAAIPAGIDPTTAAGIPTAFLTAWYALHHIGRLAAGERVLIHSATGGTGLAAVAVAKLLGADVLATAGSEKKRRHLRGMGIRHVMDSRSLDFAQQTRTATDGQGVDVVLNSLSGQAIRAGLETLRPFGRFIELGVRDINADTPLGLAPLRHNITISAVDLIELQHSRPQTFATVLREVLTAFEQGLLTPLPHRTYPLTQATDAFRLMAGAGHIGKLILTVADNGTTTAVLPEPAPQVQADGAYLVTGALRGVGLATACWLARRGARRLILNGRTPPHPATEQTLQELRTGGTQVTVILGDIAEPGTAQRLVAAATADGLPLRGLVHAAMVLDDAAITNITDEQLRRVWRPKVTGAWRLHQATAALTPDWFVLYSSMASLLGNPGQGAYAAANAWLDAFATWRTAHGLRTLAVNWGPWGETGTATAFAARGYQTIPTADGLHALSTLLAHQRVRTGVIPGEPDTWIPPAGRHSSLFSLLTHSGPSGADTQRLTPDLQATLRSTPSALARRTAMEDYLADHIRAVLQLEGTTLDPQTPLKALGFDSLLRIELRTRLESSLDIRLASDFVGRHPTLAALATGVAEHMGLNLHSDESL